MRMHTALHMYRRPYDAHTIWYGGYYRAVLASSTAAVWGGCTIAVWDGCTAYSAVLGSMLRVQSLPVHPYGCTRVVRLQLYCSCRRCYGAYATALLLRAIHLLCLSAVCMRVRLLILCCCMYVGAPAAAAVAMLWRRSVALHTRR